ncbi:ROK family transcriptional regulator [Micromonospora rosaria]|uniref:ROK family transcriptional regulator n=1 Tax=Micromonospora rosaria TaxID=47874 RepID=A0A136PVT2_9ACTN|nr:ROK family protein [Micromonospora rosaria]KXK62505.1 ROK family transcriptional regulator [Micromonospora rosaria]
MTGVQVAGRSAVQAGTPGGLLLGVDFGGTKMAVGVADGQGRLLAHERVPTHAERGAPQALERALTLAAELVAAHGGRLAAAGIASPGVVRPDGIDLAPNVPGWERLRLADAVRERLGVGTVAVDNDLNAAALAELRLGALRDADPGLVVGIGTGVAAAVTVGGRVVAGHRGAAGEIGYAVTGAHWPGTMLELEFSGRALDRLAAELGVPGGAAGLADRAGDPGRFRDVLLARVDELARHLVTCCLLLDPQRVVLVGGVAGSDLIRGLLADRLAEVLPHRPELVLSAFPDQAALLGAVTLAREAALV